MTKGKKGKKDKKRVVSRTTHVEIDTDEEEQEALDSLGKNLELMLSDEYTPTGLNLSGESSDELDMEDEEDEMSEDDELHVTDQPRRPPSSPSRPPLTDDRLTAAEVADCLGKSRRTVGRMLAAGDFPGAERTSQGWRIPDADVDAQTDPADAAGDVLTSSPTPSTADTEAEEWRVEMALDR